MKPTTRMVVAAFWMLVRHMSSLNWAWLFRPQALLDNIYTIVENPLEAVTLTAEAELPWPVALLLGSHSRKHRFPNRRLLSILKGQRAAKDLVHRLKWSYHFRLAEREQHYRPLVSRRPRPYEGSTAGEINGFSYDLMRAVREGYEKANRYIRGCGAVSLTTPRFVKWALSWMRSQNLRAVLSDKDGTFVLVRQSLLRDLVCEQLCKGQYKDVAFDTTTFQFHLIRNSSFSFCSRLTKMGFRNWGLEAAALIRDGRPANLRGQLSCTIKTHKDPGEVCCRLIHSSVGCSLNGLSAVLHRLCSDVLKQVPHICANTRDVLRQVRSTLLPSDACLCKVDVKDFFMDGEHLTLARLCSDFFAEPLKSFVYDVLLHLLHYQFVEFEDRLLRVERGTGMGLIHSSSVADLCFYALAEKNLRFSDKGCLLYLRFRDDIFFVTERAAQAGPLFSELSLRAQSCWKLKVDVCSLAHDLVVLFCGAI